MNPPGSYATHPRSKKCVLRTVMHFVCALCGVKLPVGVLNGLYLPRLTSGRPESSPHVKSQRTQVKVIHHGRPITLDLDSAEPVRCAILARLPAFRYQCPAPTSTKNTYTSAERGNSSVSKQNADGKQLHEGVGSAVAIEIGCHDGVSHCASSNKFQVVEKASVLGAGCIEEEERESEVVAAWDGDSDGLLIHKPQEGDRGECNRSECGNGDPIESGGEAVAHSGCTRGVNGEGCLENSAGTGSGPSSRGNASKSPHHEVLARIVAVLVDGRGKGWLAVRRLWSVREVGLAALLLAGLGAQDLDRQQEARAP